MPRQGRIDFPGALHHIMVRGIEKRNIFNAQNDKRDFLKRLSRVLTKTQTPCYAYAKEQESHRSKLKREGWDFTKVLEKAAETVGLESEELLRRGRSNARSYGRALLCKWMIQDLGYTQKEIAGKLGVNRSSISRMAQKGAKAEKTFKVTL